MMVQLKFERLNFYLYTYIPTYFWDTCNFRNIPLTWTPKSRKKNSIKHSLYVLPLLFEAVKKYLTSRFIITLHHANEKFFTYDNFHANTMYTLAKYFVSSSSTCEGQQAIKIKPPSGQNRDLNFHQEFKPHLY